MTVRWIDRDTLNEVCRNLGLRESVNGCYVDGVAYCPDEDTPDAYRTCGHEIRHAVKGGFHK